MVRKNQRRPDRRDASRRLYEEIRSVEGPGRMERRRRGNQQYGPRPPSRSALGSTKTLPWTQSCS